jgi:hypothetical protein
MTPTAPRNGVDGPKLAAGATDKRMNPIVPVATKKENGSEKVELPELLRFADCARDANVHVKTITRWVAAGLITEWRPHPESRTRRIKREVWKAFMQRFQK